MTPEEFDKHDRETFGAMKQCITDHGTKIGELEEKTDAVVTAVAGLTVKADSNAATLVSINGKLDKALARPSDNPPPSRIKTAATGAGYGTGGAAMLWAAIEAFKAFFKSGGTQ